MSRRRNRNRDGSNSNVVTPPSASKEQAVSDINQPQGNVQLSAETIAALKQVSEASIVQAEEANNIEQEADQSQGENQSEDPAEPATEPTPQPVPPPPTPANNPEPSETEPEVEPVLETEPAPTPVADAVPAPFASEASEDEPEVVISEEDEAPYGGEVYQVFAKQVLGYNGRNRKEAWQHFCLHVSGMIRHVNSEPDMQLVPHDTLHLVRNQIAL